MELVQLDESFLAHNEHWDAVISLDEIELRHVGRNELEDKHGIVSFPQIMFLVDLESLFSLVLLLDFLQQDIHVWGLTHVVDIRKLDSIYIVSLIIDIWIVVLSKRIVLVEVLVFVDIYSGFYSI